MCKNKTLDLLKKIKSTTMQNILKNDFVDEVEKNQSSQTAAFSTFQNQNLTNNNMETLSKTNSTMNNSITKSNTTNLIAAPNLDALKALRKTIIKDNNLVKETLITINNFYMDDNPACGIAYKEDIANTIENTNDSGFSGLANFFHYMSLGKRFKLSILLKDKMGNPYYWAEIKEGKSDISFKIPFFEGIDKMLKGDNNLKFSITMEEILNSLNEG